MQVIKRDGKVEEFCISKVVGAIQKAIKSVGGDALRSPHIALSVLKGINVLTEIITVEGVQDEIERSLIHADLADAAKSFILYRDSHEKLRAKKSLILDINKTMDGYLKQSDWRVNENSNVNYSLGGLILHNSGAITANYWLDSIYDKEISEAHRNCSLHLHDLSMFSGYCAGWSLRQLVTEGLGGVKNKISSKPAKHLYTLVQQMVNFLGCMQNEWAGAQAFSSVDTYLAPFVRADNLPYSEVKQCIQSFVFGINTPSRWGTQPPFTNVTFDWTPPADLKAQCAIVGGVPLESTYGDYQVEMDMVNKAFLEVFIEGDAEGRGFAYPIPTYNITEDFQWEGENADLLWSMTGKYGTPYFQNFIGSDLDVSDVRSMCCRLRLDKTELRKRGGGLFGADEFTGSIGVVTINLPRIGYLANDEAHFMQLLDTQMEIAKRSLEIKREVCTRLMAEGLFPYTQRYLKHWNNHFSTIGIVGMTEATELFLDKKLGCEESVAFALRVLDHMRNRMQEFQVETGNLYNLEASPSESTSYRLAKKDSELYTCMKFKDPENPYYTNSTHLEVEATDDIFEALTIQEPMQVKYTGGTVFHGFVGEEIPDIVTVRELVKKIAYQHAIPYFTITPTFSVCEEHGYIRGEQFNCPTCGTETEVYSRIVGYYRPVKNWNKGKKSEYGRRVEYSPDNSSNKVASFKD